MYWLNIILGWLNTNAGATTAIATGVIAWFTWSLSKASKSQARLISDQARLARDALELGNKEFISTHRPRLRVRRFQANVSPIAISYVVVNIGGSAAHIKKLEIRVMVPVQVGQDWKEFEPELLPMETPTLASGEPYLFIARPAKLIEQRWRRDIEIRGIIDYTDDAKVNRQIAFWRIRNPDTGSFSAKGGPDYNYED